MAEPIWKVTREKEPAKRCVREEDVGWGCSYDSDDYYRHTAMRREESYGNSIESWGDSGFVSTDKNGKSDYYGPDGEYICSDM